MAQEAELSSAETSREVRSAKELRRARARERLLAAGAREIAAQGLAAINTNTIAKAAGVGVGTFYQHFEDKFALHQALIGRAFSALERSLSRAARESAEASLAEQVRATVEATVDFAERFPQLYRVAFGQAVVREHNKPALSFSTRAVELRLRQLQRDGRLNPCLDPEAAARAFAGMQTTLLLDWTLDPKQERRTLVDTLCLLHPAIACGIGNRE